MVPLLSIKNFSVSFTENKVVEDISFDIPAKKITAIVGESGSGKSITALSLIQLLPLTASLSGEAFFSEDGKAIVDLLKINKKQIAQIRGTKISMIFQEPMTSLNPIINCGSQVSEMILQHQNISKQAAKEKVLELFRQV
jgi:peptide/nickel transport system ATP-binding protein